MPSPSEKKNAELLRACLSLAVPLWIEQLRPLPAAELSRRAEACADVIAAHGDKILFKVPARTKGGEVQPGTAEAFNKLAEALACLAFSPGGVRFMGLHFEATKGP